MSVFREPFKELFPRRSQMVDKKAEISNIGGPVPEVYTGCFHHQQLVCRWGIDSWIGKDFEPFGDGWDIIFPWPDKVYIDGRARSVHS